MGSARTCPSSSEISIDSSSALLTANSTLTFSDADYETSSEFSPRWLSARRSGSSSGLFEPSASIPLIDMEKLADHHHNDHQQQLTNVKSDTYMSLQAEMINDFMDEMLRLADQPESSQVELQDSSRSSRSDITLHVSQSSIASEDELQPETSKEPREEMKHQEVKPVEDDPAIKEKVASPPILEEIPNRTLSQTRTQILEKLAQATCDRLFSRSEQYEEVKGQGEPLAGLSSVHHQRSRLSTRRNNGVESIMRIDDELQPLNLKLSRLLAEFRAMDVRGRLSGLSKSFSSEMELKNESRRSLGVGSSSSSSCKLQTWVEEPCRVRDSGPQRDLLDNRARSRSNESRIHRHCIRCRKNSRSSIAEKQTSHPYYLVHQSGKVKKTSIDCSDGSAARDVSSERETSAGDGVDLQNSKKFELCCLEDEEKSVRDEKESTVKSSMFSGFMSMMEHCAFLARPLQSFASQVDSSLADDIEETDAHLSVEENCTNSTLQMSSDDFYDARSMLESDTNAIEECQSV